MATIEQIAEQLTIPNRNEVTLTRGDIKVTGNTEAVAYFLIKLDKEKEIKSTTKPIDEWWKNSRTHSILPVRTDRHIRVGGKLPSVREVAMAYIKSFGKFYGRYEAIEFIKGYTSRKILPRKYRGRILMSIQARQDNRAANARQYKFKKKEIKSIQQSTRQLQRLSNKIPTRREYHKRDWSSLVIEYLGLEPKPTISRFLASKNLYPNSQAYFRRYLTRAKSELTRKSKVHFQISELKSSGQKQ